MKTIEQRACSPEVLEVVAGILQEALLRIRAAGWRGDADACALEADHVHTVPEILGEHSESMLRFYWEVARPSYMKSGTDTRLFQPYWDRLEQLIEKP